MHSYVLDMYWSLRKTLLTMGSIIRGLSYLPIFYHPRFGDLPAAHPKWTGLCDWQRVA